MHSSRMRTGRSLTVCRNLLPGVGVSASGGGVCSQGVSAPGGCLPPGDGGVCSQGMSALGGIPACTEADTPPLTESQMPVKTLPWPNFVAAGNYKTIN